MGYYSDVKIACTKGVAEKIFDDKYYNTMKAGISIGILKSLNPRMVIIYSFGITFDGGMDLMPSIKLKLFSRTHATWKMKVGILSGLVRTSLI